MSQQNKTHQKRAARVRHRLSALGKLPRLSVFRSHRFIYAQIIDDRQGKTLVAAGEKEIKQPAKSKTEMASAVGKLIAQKAVQKKIKKIVFDRGPSAYAGRVRALAQAARENGLEF